MQNILRYKTIAFVMLTFWLIASWSGAHGHLCFDGQEPPVTVHMDLLGDHPEHDNDEEHVDANVDLGQFTPAKFSNIDLPLLMAAALLLSVLFENIVIVVSRYTSTYSSRRTGLRPPLRAPPVFPA